METYQLVLVGIVLCAIIPRTILVIIDRIKEEIEKKKATSKAAMEEKRDKERKLSEIFPFTNAHSKKYYQLPSIKGADSDLAKIFDPIWEKILENSDVLKNFCKKHPRSNGDTIGNDLLALTTEYSNSKEGEIKVCDGIINWLLPMPIAYELKVHTDEPETPSAILKILYYDTTLKLIFKKWDTSKSPHLNTNCSFSLEGFKYDRSISEKYFEFISLEREGTRYHGPSVVNGEIEWRHYHYLKNCYSRADLANDGYCMEDPMPFLTKINDFLKVIGLHLISFDEV